MTWFWIVLAVAAGIVVGVVGLMAWITKDWMDHYR